MMAQQDQARQHRNGESVLRFEPPDIEGRNQRAHDGPKRGVAAEQNRQQPGSGHYAGKIPADWGNGAEGGRHAFTTAEVKKYRPDMAHAGGNRHQTEPERGQA